MKKQLGRFFTAGMMVCLLTVGLMACGAPPPSPFDQTQQESTQRGVRAVDEAATVGGEFNRFFPQASDNYDRIFTQEKLGFAEIKLKEQGADVAVMSISDVRNNPTAAEKFQTATAQLQNFPMVSQGTTATVILVGDRYQVKVMSRSENFTAGDREIWLGKFDLAGLAALATTTAD